MKHAKEILCANPEIRVLEKDLKEHFDNFIRKEQLFDSKFIGIIQDNRDRIEHDVRELRKQILCVGEKEWGIT